MLHRVFSICLLLLPPAQTVVQLSMLDCASGRRSECVFFHMLQGLCPARAERKGKVVAVNGASIAPAHNTVISAGRIVI